ncbi:MAG: dienelactone hydrolase family protein, partial [Candidatus Binatia bacterium]
MVSSWENTKIDNSNMPLYLCVPERGGPVPGIVVVHGQSGLENFIKDTTHMLALQGYASLDLKAAVMFYGSSTMAPFGEGPSPFDRTREISCPLQGHFGADDQNPSPEDMRKLDAELSRWNKPHEFHTYVGAAHAFANATSANYRPHAAPLAWPNATEFFSLHLVG